jgi:peptidoglycan hydrolase CwlO-like protein
VGTIQKEKTTLALIGLCLVVGLMVLLSSVYYTRANDVQNTSNAQIAVLQSEKTNLQQQVTQQNAQINTLNTHLSSLGAENQALSAKVDSLNNEIDSLNNGMQSLMLQIIQLQSTSGQCGGSRLLMQ